MHLLQHAPLCLLLLVLQAVTEISATPSNGNTRALPRLVRRAHESAVRRTHSLARDIRVAFGRVLPRAETDSDNGGRVVYCKPGGKQTVLDGPKNGGGEGSGSGIGSSGNSTSTSAPQGSSSSRGSSTRTRSSTSAAQPTATAVDSPWRLTNSYQGDTFFQGWDFFTSPDPTHGLVDYIDEASARRDGILEINSAGNAIMRVETTPTVPGNRKSIRITTQAQFNGGLVIMDAVHMPHGCGTWPAFWTNGPNWPNGGEIDILEGVHDYANNQATLHTSDGCTIASSSSSALAISGSVIAGTDCSVSTTSNQGCGIRANSATTYGSGFNDNGGGVYAMKWDSTGIAVYFFPRDSIPADITANTPLPETWGAAQARWPAASCDPFRFFNNHHAIFDTTLCGDWAGGVWNAAGIPGQEQSCAQRTGFSTCDAFIRARGSAFQEAYWEVRYMQIYEER